MPTHGDFQPRNLRWDDTADARYAIDFEQSAEGPAARGSMRLSVLDAVSGISYSAAQGDPELGGARPAHRGRAPRRATPLNTTPPHTRSSTLTYTARDQWEQHYGDGKGFRQLGEREQALLAEHTPAPDGGGRALDLGCGTGDLSVYLTSLGYTVDACDFADSALARAQEQYPGALGVRWICMDIERDDPAELNGDGYDLVVLRLVYPFFSDRMRVLHGLGERLRPGGALVVITPVVEHTPAQRRGVALDEDEIGLLTGGWERAERFDADRLAVLVLRGPRHADTRSVERRRPPSGPAATAALAVVTD
ncbi:class I SAM-dependent methyltransferase [Streptomyces sp. NPDC052042]|uniref:class I SAM-dependent methyltransferase n=1 Tax=Streptomyces sp. NPDC052042 TaxID=3365683 RepID=UPI0037D4745C